MFAQETMPIAPLMTRFAVFLFCTAITLSLSAQDAPLPDKLSALKTSYHAAVSRATAPLTKTYATELERLKIDYTKKGDLSAALAVDAELKALAAANSPQKPGEEPTDPGSSKAKLKSLLPSIRIDGDGKWKYGNFPVMFTETEAILQPESKQYKQKGTYEVTGPRKVRLMFPAGDGNPQKTFDIEFTRDMTGFTSNSPDLKGKVSTITPK